MDFIKAIEDSLGIEAKKNFMDIQPGDVPATSADVADLVSRPRLQTRYTGQGGCTPVCGVVSGVLWGVTSPRRSRVAVLSGQAPVRALYDLHYKYGREDGGYMKRN